MRARELQNENLQDGSSSEHTTPVAELHEVIDDWTYALQYLSMIVEKELLVTRRILSGANPI